MTSRQQIVIPSQDWPAPLITMNQMRGQSRYLAYKTRPWRHYARDLAKHLISTDQLQPVETARVWMRVRHRDNRRRDTPNVMPVAKAIIDGLVDAGTFTDDCDGILEGPLLVRHYPNGPRQIILDIESPLRIEEAPES